MSLDHHNLMKTADLFVFVHYFCLISFDKNKESNKTCYYRESSAPMVHDVSMKLSNLNHSNFDSKFVTLKYSYNAASQAKYQYGAL